MSKKNNKYLYNPELIEEKLDSDDAFDKLDVQLKTIAVLQCFGMLLTILFGAVTVGYLISFKEIFILAMSLR